MRQTADTATELTHHLLKGSVLEFGADPERYLATDLLGRRLQQLSNRGEKSGRGAFHMPDVVTDHMVEYFADDLPPGTVIGEAAADSGAVWRAGRLLHCTALHCTALAATRISAVGSPPRSIHSRRPH